MLLDITRLVGRSLNGYLATGVDRVTLAYFQHFRSEVSGILRYQNQWVIVPSSLMEQFYQLLSNPTPTSKRSLQILITKAIIFGLTQTLKGHVKSAIILNIDHSGLDSHFYKHLVKKLRLEPIYFLHDLIPITHPEYCRAGEYQRHQQRLNTMLTTGSCIITNSNDTLERLKEYASTYYHSMPNAIIAPLGTPPLQPTPCKPLLTKPYFVMLSTIEPRKNHWLILHIWRLLVKRMGNQTPTLVLIGRRGWECENIIDLLERCPSLQEHVIELHNCKDEELNSYLHFSQALLFPSFVEGYGLPIVEAMQAGVPVIASDLAVFREFAHDIPEYLSPLDAPAWISTIVDYSNANHPRRLSQIQKLKDYTPPSWKRHFAIVDAFLDKSCVKSSA